MTAKRRKQILLAAAGLAILALLIYGLLPERTRVVGVPVQEAPLVVDVEAEGVTALQQRYEIAAPVTAWMRRVEVDVGDRVAAGAPLVVLEAPPAAALDARSRAEAEARLETARAALAETATRTEAAAVEAERLRTQAERLATLAEQGSATPAERDQAVAAAEAAEADRETAQAAVVRAHAEVAAAEASLYGPGGATGNRPVIATLTAPVTGAVVEVMQRSAGPVQAGTPLLAVADPARLNVEVDVLSSDAVALAPGTPVVLTEWGRDEPLEAVVRRVEPSGFTEVSSLGVEEQRVPVIAEITSPPSAWASLGAGYRVLASFIVHQVPRAIVVPASAVFRTGEGWAAYVIEDGEVHLRTVTLGHRSGLQVQVTGGLTPGEVVVAQPSSDLEDGLAVDVAGEPPLERGTLER